MNLVDKLQAIWIRHQEVNDLLMQPELANDHKRFIRLNKEFKDLDQVVEARNKYLILVGRIEEAKDILSNEKDLEMREIASSELEEIQPVLEELELEIQKLLIPKDPEDTKDAVLEVRAGTGGDEAGLFVGDLVRMYLRFIEDRGWSAEWLTATEGSAGGYKEASIEIKGQDVYGTLKYESGVHRVQRVPSTESQGRVHTSAITVAVLPEAEEVDFDLNMADVKKDTYRSSGAGGQHVNKTESAVRLTHIPTNTVVECQDGRSQHKNYEKALQVLRSRLYQAEAERLEQERADQRKSLVSSGDRSAKIRTYNYPQGRITDHRIGKTIYNLSNFMNGDIQEMIDALIMAENAEKLNESNIE